MTDERTEMNAHVEAAIRELNLAAASGDCGVCAGLLGEQAAQLRMLLDLSGKVEQFVDSQQRTHTELAEGNRSADEQLGPVQYRYGTEAGVAPATTRNGLGVVDMAQDIWRTRIRFTDALTLGGRR